jgi:hypothetical protein
MINTDIVTLINYEVQDGQTYDRNQAGKWAGREVVYLPNCWKKLLLVPITGYDDLSSEDEDTLADYAMSLFTKKNVSGGSTVSDPSPVA